MKLTWNHHERCVRVCVCVCVCVCVGGGGGVREVATTLPPGVFAVVFFLRGKLKITRAFQKKKILPQAIFFLGSIFPKRIEMNNYIREIIPYWKPKGKKINLDANLLDILVTLLFYPLSSLGDHIPP